MARLLHACVSHLQPGQLELPMGLISRLVLGDVSFVTQFADSVHQVQVLHTVMH